ncbi:MAG: hypothetical protein BGO69_12380 [Bacteroidetes bacterium 46-16]|nr:MAG: hypothetical protein BGO69_12380 [Bacteroidetes bacterium 46-16]
MNSRRILSLLLTATILGFHCASAQNIDLFAGTPLNPGNTGDGGPAVSARLSAPQAICFDKFGNAYISDQNNHRVRKISASGDITAFAGTGAPGYSGDGGAALSATFCWPTGIAVDTTGNVYITDVYCHVVRKVNTSGIISTIAGTGSIGYSGDGGPAVSAALNTPVAVDADIAGNVYIVDRGNARIRMIDMSGNINTIAGTGTHGFSGDNAAATSAELNYPANIAFDNTGNIYIADQLNERIRKIDAGGIITTIAGNGIHSFSGDGSAATSASLEYPMSVALDSSGNMFIADGSGNRVRMVDGSGIIYTYAGTGVHDYGGDGGLAINAYLTPLDLAVGIDNRLYVDDMIHANIRVITPAAVSTGALSRQNDGLELYPNANNGIFTLAGNIGSKDPNVQIEVLDLNGKTVLKDNFQAQNGRIKKQIALAGDLPAGHYMIKITTDLETKSIKFDKR